MVGGKHQNFSGYVKKLKKKKLGFSLKRSAYLSTPSAV